MRVSRSAAALLASLAFVSPVLAQKAPAKGTAVATATPIETPPAASPLPSDPFAAELARRLGEPAAPKERAERQQTLAAYQARDWRPLWIEAGRFTAKARAAMAEVRRADDWGLSAAEFALPADPVSTAPADLATAELQLTRAVLKYASFARGGRMDPTDLTFAIDRQPPLLAATTVLDAIGATDAPDAYLRGLHPRHPQFEKLRQLYLALKAGTYQDAAAAEPAGPVATEPATSGRKGKKTEAAKKPVGKPALTAQRVLYNMEMWRWMPDDLGAFHVVDNIPEFMMRVVKDGKVVHAERIVVGKVENQTPMFSMDMKTIVMQPSWGVPNSIKVKELLPGLMRGSDSFARNGLKATYRGREVSAGSLDWSRVDIRNLDVIQPPGPSNVLGVVKFLFPNKHDVYMHDTPSKSLFNADVRTFSHGCMRVRNPVRLAEVILAHDKGWSAAQVDEMIRKGPANNNVQLTTRVPVHVTYFTVVVGDDGKPQVFRDVYGHEPKIQMGLDGKAHLIVKKKENLADVVAQLAETRRQYRGSGSWGDDEDDRRPRSVSNFGSSSRGGGAYQPYRGSSGGNDVFKQLFGG